MEKISFINNSQPALNATNLNKLQDNVEDAIESSGIIESDYNANGSWVKFGDGTMIITQTKTTTAVIEVADGSVYRGNLGVLPDFPIPFVGNPPTITLSITNAFKTFVAGQEGVATTTRAFDYGGSAALIGIYSATSKTLEDVKINLIAIGRWK